MYGQLPKTKPTSFGKLSLHPGDWVQWGQARPKEETT